MSRNQRRPKSKPERTETFSVRFSSIESDDRFLDDVDVAQIDLLTDLNRNFFTISYQLVHALVPVNNFIAAKIKRYVDILARLHTRYVNEVNTNANFQKEVGLSEERVRLAIETSADSNEVMNRIKEDLAEAWRTADAAEVREVNVQIAQEDYTNLEVAKRTAGTPNSEKCVDAGKMRLSGFVFRERDRLASELKDYQKRLETNRFYSQSLEELVVDLRYVVSKQQVSLKTFEEELFLQENNFRTTTEALEGKIIHQRKEIENVSLINQDLRLIEKKYHEIMIIHAKFKEQFDRHAHENIALMKANRQLEEDKQLSKTRHTTLETKIKALQNERDSLKADFRACKREIKKISELNTLFNRRFLLLAKKNSDLVEQGMLTTNELHGVERKLSIALSKVEESNQQKAEVERGREKMRVEIVNIKDIMATLKHDIVVQRNRMQSMQFELNRFNVELDCMDTKLLKINREKTEALSEVNELSTVIQSLEENLASKTEKITISQERLQQKQKDYLSVKKQLEFIQTEKTNLEKNLGVCVRDRQSLQNINTQVAFQVDQLCNQVARNEKDIATKKKQIDQLERLLKHKQNEIHSKEQCVQRLRSDLSDNKMRNERLQHTIEEDEKRLKHISYSLDEVRKEKMLEGQQMVRRNGELRVQHEKLTMMQLALDNGTMQYNQRVEDIRLLKTELSNVRQSNECLQRGIGCTANMRREVVRLERQLVRERLQVAAFMDEMKHPYRIHRWRVVRGKDPHKFELIRKVQLLLKRNVRQSAERVNLEQKLHDMQQLYDTLKEQVQRLPDVNCKHLLWLQKRKTQQQQRKLRAIKAELAINEIDLKSKNCIIEQFQHVIKVQNNAMPNIISPIPSSSAVNTTNKSKYTDQVFRLSSEIWNSKMRNEGSTF